MLYAVFSYVLFLFLLYVDVWTYMLTCLISCLWLCLARIFVFYLFISMLYG